MTSLLRRISSRRSRTIAIDLGTARTRIAIPGEGVCLDEPTLIAYDSHGDPQAAGRAAWDSAVSGPGRLCYPVRHGRVVDPAAIVQMLQIQLGKIGMLNPALAAVGVPAGTSKRGCSELTAMVGAATSAPAIPIDASLAAAIGVGLDVKDERPRLLLDVGAGTTQLAVIWDGHAPVQKRLAVGTRQYLDEPHVLVCRLNEALRQVLESVRELSVGDAAAGPMWVVGGGALLPCLQAELTATLDIDVRIVERPRSMLALGLAACAANVASARVTA